MVSCRSVYSELSTRLETLSRELQSNPAFFVKEASRATDGSRLGQEWKGEVTCAVSGRAAPVAEPS